MKSLFVISKILSAAAVMSALTGPARADVIIDWNIKADTIAAQKQIFPAGQGRALSMMHVAMFEAVNAIEHRYTPHKLTLSAERSTSKEAAAATAAHDVLVSIYADQKADLDSALSASLAAVADGVARSEGIELGRKAAAAES